MGERVGVQERVAVGDGVPEGLCVPVPVGDNPDDGVND